MDVDGRDGGEASRLVQVRFVTKLQHPYKAPNASIAIPGSLTRRGLSIVVNDLLKSRDSDWVAEPFDFLIDGELVRLSLEEFLVAKNISAEKVLEIEYIKAVVPRKQEEPLLHDDWVSAVDASHPEFILTGCYDGFGRLWNAGRCSHVLEGHSDALTSVSIVNQKGEGIITVATGSKDRTLRLWKIDTEKDEDQDTRIRASKILRGHRGSVQSIAAKPSGDMVCSGSWDCTISIWETNESESASDAVSVKKRKVSSEDDEAQLEGEAATTLVGHTQCVSSVVWKHPETIYSASWDHSVRSWDVETGKDTWDMFCGKVLNCIDVGGESHALIAAGGSDPILKIWDPRKPGTSAPIYTFSSHSSWISACKWHSKSVFHLVTASYDGKVMLWDLRTAWPLAVIDSHKDKVLCADWWKGDSIVSGGADSNVNISSNIPL
uniref:Ribosome biogenesis protein WDR12 homolog n=1 Tax=Kalanchoe fedtschenkoi TaxID=63787 RepID=A0A7N0T8E5_KALFE